MIGGVMIKHFVLNRILKKFPFYFGKKKMLQMQ